MKIETIVAIGFIGVSILGSAFADAQTAVVSAVQSVSVTVADMDRSARFYEDVLHFKREFDRTEEGEAVEHRFGVFGAHVRVVGERLGDEHLQLIQFLAPMGRPIPTDSKSNDLWFQHVAIIVSNMDSAYQWLRQHNVQHASSGPQLLPDWNPNAGGIAAFYFRDPDGHNLEVLHFPKGKGDPKWQRTNDDLFLGIDHTAIAVADTEASLTFYRDTLGLRIAGESENYGAEQEHLNNVFAAHLRITALRAASGPGVELLEYLAPHTGRAFPIDSQANDLWHWHIDMATNVAQANQALRAAHFHFAAINITKPPTIDTLLVRDVDGHALLLQSPKK